MSKTTTSTTLIKATGINRYYGNTHAVKNLEFELHAGDILGFLGPNGAGKSTSMQILSGSLAPDAGQITINGFDLVENPTQAKQQLGYLPEQPPLYKELTVDEYLGYCAQLRKLDKNTIDSAISKAKQRCGLSDVGSKMINNLSKGYQQRVGIAQAIIHSPAVIILDEPTVGLDPIQIQEIRQLITELGEEHGIILSTHILPEVQAVCNRVQIIQQGELVYHNDMQSINAESQSSQTDFCFREKVNTQLFDSIDGVENIEILDNESLRISFSTDNSKADNAHRQLLKIVNEQSWTLLSMLPKTRSLEQIFIELTTNENSASTESTESAT